MSGADKLAPALKPILAAVREHAPRDMQFALAHPCTYRGRSYVHITFRNGDSILSFIVTRKQSGEWLTGLRTAVMDGHQVAGFETGGSFVYAVSDLPAPQNQALLATAQPSLRSALQE